MHDPREPHLAALKRILRYVRGTLHMGLLMCPSTALDLVVYSDADWAGCPDTRKSISGYAVFLGDNLVSWSSKRQNTVSRSSAEVEYRAVANAVAATQIYEARGGKPQDIEVDLSRGHNYLDADTGMTPTLNGQEITLDLVAGNPFIPGIYETSDGRHVIPSAVYVDLVYQWSTFLGCAVNASDVAAAIKKWHSSGQYLST